MVIPASSHSGEGKVKGCTGVHYSIGTVLNVNNAKIVDSTGISAYFLTYYGMICRSYALNLKFLYGKNHRTF